MTKLIAALRFLISATFIASAVSKLVSLGLFEITLIDQGLFAERSSAAVAARLLIGVELAIGLLYLQPMYLKRLISPVTMVLLIAFTGHLAYLAAIGDNRNCGCFGELIAMSPLESIVKNILLLAIVVFVHRRLETVQGTWRIPAGLAAVALIGVWAWAPVKSIGDFPFSRYTQFEPVGRVDLSDGEKLLCVFNLDCEHCQEAARELASLQRDGTPLPEVYVLFFSEDAVTPDSFFTVTNSRFPYRMIELAEFLDFIGNAPPRIYWLKEGSIERFWDGEVTDPLRKNFR